MFISNLEVHTFDPTLDEDTAQRLHRTPGIQFHAWGLAAGGPMHPDPGEEAAAQAEAGGALAAYDDKVPCVFLSIAFCAARRVFDALRVSALRSRSSQCV